MKCMYGLALVMGALMWTEVSAWGGEWSSPDGMARLEMRRKQKKNDKRTQPEEECGHCQKGRSLVVLYESDVHCAIEGYAKLAGLRDAIADTADVAIVSSGDFLQGGTAGALSKGQYIADMMRTVGYDAVTLGNHEFDFKMPRMFELLRQLAAPVVCANLYDGVLGRDVFAPYVIKRMGGKKVAFVGAATPGTMETEGYAFYDSDSLRYDLQHEDVYADIQRAADDARKNGADYVVVISHLGRFKIDRGVDSYGLIKNTQGIDVLLDGHTHEEFPCDTLYNKVGKPVLFSQTGMKFANVGKMVITPDGHITTELVPMKDIPYENQVLKEMADSMQREMDAVTKRVICQCDYPMVIEDAQKQRINRMQETNAGDLVADAFRVMAESDVAVVNAGSIRSAVEPGSLTYGDFVSMLPYDNFLTVVELRGDSIVSLLANLIGELPVPSGQFPQVSGLKFRVNASAHTVSDVQVLNTKTNTYAPIDMNHVYTLATTDYCVSGGGLNGKLANSKVVKDAFLLYSNALVEYVEKVLKGHIGAEYAKPQGRIVIQ